MSLSSYNWRLQTPVAFLIFNRPETTAPVFAEIAKARPPKLLVVADGARPERPGEAEKCAAARAIVERVDWDCEVLSNYADTNLGCKKRVSSGLDWVFANVEEAIILEDDCLPQPTFFRFCEELLDRYRGDERIMMISGDNFLFGKRKTEFSYYFSRYAHTWGWASWRRAWQHYDVNLGLWPKIKKENWLRELLGKKSLACYWMKVFDNLHAGRIDTWDYQLTFAGWLQNSLNILPSVNLVSNIGFMPSATHTKVKSRLANMTSKPMHFPLSHPPYMLRDAMADRYTESLHFKKPSLSARIANRIKGMINSANVTFRQYLSIYQ